MKIKAIFYIWILISPLGLFAQDSYLNTEIKNIIGHLNWNKEIQPSSAEIQGSPYLNAEFREGVVYFEGKYKISRLPLRVNLYNDEIEYKERNVIMAFAKPASIDKVELGREVFIYIEGDKKSAVSGFVKMWNEQFPTVLTKMKIDYFKKEDPKPYVDPKPDRFERAHDKHYLMKSRTDIEKILSVKKLIKSLGKHQTELSAFAKKEKISVSDPEELVKLIDFYQRIEKDL